MSDAIFLLREGKLEELTDAPYNSESLLQQLLADYPSLIAGSQIDTTAPRRWLLVSREMSVPGEEQGAGRWSLDHLFLDQDGIPTLVEVKRSTDTRIRREVVGQMLDYAANAVVYWPVEQIISRFEARCAGSGKEPTEELGDLLQGESDPQTFWSAVKTNLQAGKVRLIFVADIIPPELRRVVEFLNIQMDPAEVLALEIKQYVGEGLQTLVPRVIGRTAEAERKKAAGSQEKRTWDEASFFAAIEERNSKAIADVARQIFSWAQKNGKVWFGNGVRSGSFGLTVLTANGENRYFFAAYTYGAIEIYFQWLKNGPPFDEEAKRREFLSRLNAIEGIDLPDDAVTRRPNIKLATLQSARRLAQFLGVLDWAVREIQMNGGA